MRHLGWLGLLSFLGGQGMACSNSSTTTADAAVCSGPFEELSQGCPANYDGTPPNLPQCITFGFVLAQPCADLIKVQFHRLVDGRLCFYDKTTHELVGASIYTDYKQYCNATSIERSGGRVARCRGDTPVIARRDCRDAGATD